MKRNSLLIVEDDISLLTTLQIVFSRRDFNVNVACSVSEAKSAIKQNFYNYYLLDLNVINESALSLIPTIKIANNDAIIVIMTGYASIATAVQAIKLGATNYLPKPLDLNELLKSFSDANNQIHCEKDTSAVTVSFDSMSVKRLEWEHIQKKLADNNGNISKTARDLKMHRRTLQRKLQKRPAGS